MPLGHTVIDFATMLEEEKKRSRATQVCRARSTTDASQRCYFHVHLLHDITGWSRNQTGTVGAVPPRYWNKIRNRTVASDLEEKVCYPLTHKNYYSQKNKIKTNKKKNKYIYIYHSYLYIYICTDPFLQEIRIHALQKRILREFISYSCRVRG